MKDLKLSITTGAPEGTSVKPKHRRRRKFLYTEPTDEYVVCRKYRAKTHKTCRDCKEEKPLSEFDQMRYTHMHGSKLIRFNSYCKPCQRERTRKQRANLTEEEVTQRLDSHKAYMAANKLKQKELGFIRNYGVTLARVEEMKVEQDGRCLICLRSDRNLVVDHQHGKPITRGLLCPQCNSALGLLGENVEIVTNMAKYIRERCVA